MGIAFLEIYKEPISDTTEMIFHAGEIVFHTGEIVSHTGEIVFHTSEMISHTLKTFNPAELYRKMHAKFKKTLK